MGLPHRACVHFCDCVCLCTLCNQGDFQFINIPYVVCYVYVCVCMWVCVCIYESVYVNMCVCLSPSLCVCLCVSEWVCVCVCACASVSCQSAANLDVGFQFEISRIPIWIMVQKQSQRVVSGGSWVFFKTFEVSPWRSIRVDCAKKAHIQSQLRWTKTNAVCWFSRRHAVVFLSIDSDCNRLTQCLLIEFLSDSFQSNLLRTLHDGDAFSDATVMLGRQVCVPLYTLSRKRGV